VRASLLGPAPPDYAGHVLYRALVPIEAVPDTPGDCVALWLYPGGHVVHYPVSGARRMNIVVAGESPGRRQRLGSPGRRRRRARLPARRGAAACRHAAGAATVAPMGGRRPASTSRWGDGLATLIGDAAHPILPYLAQGAVMALEDAVVLGHCVTAEPTMAESFRAYERQRRPASPASPGWRGARAGFIISRDRCGWPATPCWRPCRPAAPQAPRLALWLAGPRRGKVNDVHSQEVA
jgi:2-polyprenyl-6-methoxyphenol hydroxylase-like FAD-dependent oxidoreductase